MTPTTWLIFRDEASYRDLVGLTAVTPFDMADRRELQRRALDCVEQAAMPEVEPPQYAVSLSAALDAVRTLRRARLAPKRSFRR